MNDINFMRYSRQILLEDITINGQKNLLASKVLIVGLGGLGSPAAIYLTGAGVGTIILADSDYVHISNLQRQILFTTSDIAQPKAKTAVKKLMHLNPTVKLLAIQQRLMGNALLEVIDQVDIVLDCTDNMTTRHEINAACVKLNTSLITAGAIGLNGQLATLVPPWKYGCYRCFCPDDNKSQRNCSMTGILGPVVGIMGTMQALEAIKLLIGMKIQCDRLHLFDARTGNWCKIMLQRASNCPVCGEL